MKENLYKRITDQVLQNLEAAGSWQKLWDVPQPVSLNDHKYSGINHLLLSTSEYESPVWGTFNQVRANGGAVKKGESSRLVVFWKRLTDRTTDSLTGKTEEVVKYLLRYYSVFNTGQCTFDRIGEQRINELSKVSERLKNERITSAEQIIHTMPDLKYFFNADAYYAALFHELVHSYKQGVGSSNLSSPTENQRVAEQETVTLFFRIFFTFSIQITEHYRVVVPACRVVAPDLVR